MLIKINIDDPRVIEKVEQLKSHYDVAVSSKAVLNALLVHGEHVELIDSQSSRIKKLTKKLKAAEKVISDYRSALQVLREY